VRDGAVVRVGSAGEVQVDETLSCICQPSSMIMDRDDLPRSEPRLDSDNGPETIVRP
jgi:hypothetical protein